MGECYGSSFRLIRENLGLSLTNFEKVGVKRQTVASFEAGKSMMAVDKFFSCLELMDIPFETFKAFSKNNQLFKKYGEVFHELREQRNFKLEDFKLVGIAPITLSSFENGGLYLRVNYLISALDLMHISLSEYESLINEGGEDYFTDYYRQIEVAQRYGDRANLRKIYQEASQFEGHRMIALSAKSCLCQLDESEIEEVGSFLFGLDYLTNLELFTFIFTVKDLPTGTIECLVTDFSRSYKKYDNYLVYRRNIVRAAVRASFVCISRLEAGLARRIIKQIPHFILTKDEYSRMIYRFAIGFYEFKILADDKGMCEMKKIIEIADYLGDSELSLELTQFLEEIEG